MQPNPRMLSSPSCCVSHQAAGPGSTLGAPSRDWEQLSCLLVPISAVPSHRHTRTELASAESLMSEGINRENKACKAAGQGSCVPGTAVRVGTCARDRFQEQQSQATSCPLGEATPATAEGPVEPCSGPSPGAHCVQPGVLNPDR